jgi:hypothetical protein
MPDDAEGGRPVVRERLDPELSAPHPTGAHLRELHEKGRGLSGLQLGDAGKSLAILVAKRKRQKEVGDRGEAGLGEPRGAGRADARDPADRVAQMKDRGRPVGKRGNRRQALES